MGHTFAMVWQNRSSWKRYGLAIALGVIVILLGQFYKSIGFSLVAIAYVALIASAIYGGRGPALVCCALTTGLVVFIAIQTGEIDRLSFKLTLVLFPLSGVAIALIMASMSKAQRQAEELTALATQQSKRLYTTLKSIGDAVVVTDPQGLIVSLNPVAEELTGWQETEALGRRLGEILRMFHEETQLPLADPIERIKHEHHAVELPPRSVLVSRDGTERAIDDSAAPIRGVNDVEQGYVLVFRDITARRKAEKQLADAETRFRAFMDRSPAIAFIKNSEGRYLWGNAAWRSEHPDAPDCGIGMTDGQLWSEPVEQQFRQSDQKLLQTREPEEFIQFIPGENGEDTRWLTIKFPLTGEGTATLIGGIAINITENYRHEQAVLESEARYRLLFEAIPQPTWLIDGENARFLAANEAAIRVYGYSNEEFLGMTVHGINLSEDLAELDKWLTFSRDLLTAEKSWRHRKRDGSVIQVQAFCHALQINGRKARVVIALDVTERLKAENSLRLNRERLELALDGARLGLWYCDLASGRLTLNELARAHFGLATELESTLENYLKRVHPDDRETIRESISRAVREGDRFVGEHRVVIDSNRTQWLRVIGQAHADEGARATRFDGISIDITEQKQDELRLREATQAAVEANNTKSKFLAMLGHELRTPLTPVLAAVSEFLDNPMRKKPGNEASPREVRDLLTMIKRNIEVEARLISDLLDVSRFERGEFQLERELVDFNEVIRQGIDICREAVLVSGLNVVTEFRAEHSFVDGDHARLMQIVWNLVQNAAKYTQHNGKLLIRTSNSPAFASEGGSENEKLIVEFIDDGVGIDPEFITRAFDPFEQGSPEKKSRYSGLGLGLAISRSIATSHGGSLSVTSEGRGKGASFRLELVAAQAVALGALPPRLEGTPKTSVAKRILLVEDNMDTLRYLTILLRIKGFTIESARRLAEATHHLENGEFDILVSDIQLPDGSGLDLMRKYRSKVRGIALSGFGSDADEALSIEAGFSAHLTKPVDITRLEAAIQRVLNPTPS